MKRLGLIAPVLARKRTPKRFFSRKPVTSQAGRCAVPAAWGTCQNLVMNRWLAMKLLQVSFPVPETVAVKFHGFDSISYAFRSRGMFKKTSRSGNVV